MAEKGEEEQDVWWVYSRQVGRKAGGLVEVGRRKTGRDQEYGEKTGWRAAGTKTLLFSPGGLLELPKMQVDPILALQYKLVNRDGNPGGIWQ